jgi:hypothetical protein
MGSSWCHTNPVCMHVTCNHAGCNSLQHSPTLMRLLCLCCVQFYFPPGDRSVVEYRSASRIGESDGNINRWGGVPCSGNKCSSNKDCTAAPYFYMHTWA